MDEVQIGKELMDKWISLASFEKTKEAYIESAKRFDDLSDWYKSIGDLPEKG